MKKNMPKTPFKERRQNPEAAKRYVQPTLIPVLETNAIETFKTLNGLMREEAKAKTLLKNAQTPVEKEKALKELGKVDNAINEAIDSFSRLKNLHINASERRGRAK